MKKIKVTFNSEAPATVHWSVEPTPAGKVILGLTPKGAICRVSTTHDGKPEAVLKRWKKEWPETNFVKAAKSAGKSLASLPLSMTGTPFQQKVWKGLLSIPAGETLSYAALARGIGHPKAARAVGNACGKNPVLFLVPCHRVVANDGGLGGFSSGLPLKKLLLEREAKPKKKA